MQTVMANVPETELLERLKAKDVSVFEIMIKKHELEIYNYINKMMHDQMLAMDIWQETIIKAFKYLDKYDTNYSFKGWLYALAKNLIVDETRKKYFHQKKLTTSLDEGFCVASAKEVADDMEHQSLKEALDLALSKLPDKLRSIITLCDVLEMSYSEAAEIEKINIGTVKSRLNRGRNALRNMKHLKEYL